MSEERGHGVPSPSILTGSRRPLGLSQRGPHLVIAQHRRLDVHLGLLDGRLPGLPLLGEDQDLVALEALAVDVPQLRSALTFAKRAGQTEDGLHGEAGGSLDVLSDGLAVAGGTEAGEDLLDVDGGLVVHDVSPWFLVVFWPCGVVNTRVGRALVLLLSR